MKMTKKVICPLGDTVAVRWDRREESNKSNWKKGLGENWTKREKGDVFLWAWKSLLNKTELLGYKKPVTWI